MSYWQTCVGNCQPFKTCTLGVALYKMVDESQDECKATFKFIEEVHSCPAVWDVLSKVYKDTKNKQKNMEEPADKLSFIQTFLALCFFSSQLLFHCSM